MNDSDFRISINEAFDQIDHEMRSAQELSSIDRLGARGNGLAVRMVGTFVRMDSVALSTVPGLQEIFELAGELDHTADQPEIWEELFARWRDLQKKRR